MFALKKSMAGPGVWDNADRDDLTTRPIDVPRPIKVIVIGAGISGMIAAILFPRKIENLELVIYEKNADLGGTWFENNYPGIACDIPSHVYQFTFEENTQWSSYYAPGAEIQEYLKGVNSKYGAYKYMKFRRQVQRADWNGATGRWSVGVEDLATGEISTDTADVVVSAVGILNQWKWPKIPGLHEFKGRLVHSADWPSDLDVSGKRVALIGGGSSGIQILPQLQRTAKSVDHYMRSRTWIPPAGIGGQGLAERNGDARTPAAELEIYRRDPKAYTEYRRTIEDMLHRPVEALYKNTEGAKVLFDMCRAHMEEKLAKKPEIFHALVPDFPPGCRRITPGPGYLEALIEDNVEFIPSDIQTVYADGIETTDGKRREVDVIICATGFDGVYKQHFPVHGKHGANLQDLWNVIPEAYLSVAPRLMPNYYVFLGPNGGPGLGSTVPFLELQAKYMMEIIQKVQREYIKSMTPKEEALQDFGEFIDEYFVKTIYSADCKAWWKHRDGRLLAIWPGSLLHGAYAFSHPRWEDYDYEMRPELKGNRLAWFGNGLSKRQLDMKGTTEYLGENAHVPVENPLEHRTGPEVNGAERGNKGLVNGEIGHVGANGEAHGDNGDTPNPAQQVTAVGGGV